MFLTSLTLRGFKSFPDRTVLDLEPGITVIVGPNGSGKSNVVDALAWVLGTRSPKVLRGGELADVIFAGSPTRPPASRAVVEIAIDNRRGQLGRGGEGVAGSAREFPEVRISREILPTGESIYAINGVECRLLDIQELLSDRGMGRELHTVVGQGQVDAVLQARPEDRRLMIEEAAGITKHRRRRERAQRKLEQVDDHVGDLRRVLGELERQLRPLERQAEAADRHARLHEQLRAVRVERAVHHLAQLRELWSRVAADARHHAGRQDAVADAAAAAGATVDRLEDALRRDAPRVDAARDAVDQLARLHERLAGTAELIEARRRHLLEVVDEPLAGRPPGELRAAADRLDAEHARRTLARDGARTALAAAAATVAQAQQAVQDHHLRRTERTRARSAARERMLRWEAEMAAHRRALAAAEAETGRLSAQLRELTLRGDEVDGEAASAAGELHRLRSDEQHLAQRSGRAREAVADRERALEAALGRERDLERARASERARADALRAAADADGGAAALLSSGLDGLRGTLGDHVRIRPGREAAVAAALGPLGAAVVAGSSRQAGTAVAHLRAQRAGRAVVLPARDGEDSAAPTPAAPPGTEPAVDLVAPKTAADAGVVAALRHALAGTFLAAGWSEAVALHEQHPDLTFVTAQGDVAGPGGFVGGAEPERSAVLAAAAAEEAAGRVTALDRELEQARAAIAAIRRELADRRGAHDAVMADVHGADARLAGAEERLERLGREREGLDRQRRLLTEQADQLRHQVEEHGAALAALESDPPPPPVPAEDPVDDAEGDQLARSLDRARGAEVEARLEVERLDQQLRHLAEQASALRTEATDVEAELAAATRRRELRREHIRRCGELAAVCEAALAALDTSTADATAERDRLVTRAAERQAARDEAREHHRDLSTQLDALRDERHAAELHRAEVRRDLDDVEEKLRQDLGLPPDQALIDHPDALTYDDATLEAREDELIRRLGLLGRINPLALEEFRAVEERHAFITAQLADLLAGRRDLQRVIAAVDDKIREVFAEAFADVAREFEVVFGALFPGGRGRLTLTDAEHLLTTGIEVEATPPGKRVRRLSLLSGGERSLTALALLFAIFRARPSPFYVLDEVEAALDDVNLQRLLTVIESFKEHSQVLVVTHQRRTMEIADVLYGITMGRDAVSTVVAERLSEPEPVPA